MSRTWLLTGGAGFIGSNYADRHSGRSARVSEKPLAVRPESPRETRIVRRCEMWCRKAAVVVPLLQRLAAPQIGARSGTRVPEWALPHSRFSAAWDFPAGPLESLLHCPRRERTGRPGRGH